MPRSKKCFGRLSRFEALETRALLAGNVLVAVNAGELDISGGNANNNIQVTQLASGQWRVTGIATNINGANSPFTSDPANPVTGNIVINLSGGSDTLKVANGDVPGALLINADDVPSTSLDGNDNVQLSNVTTALSTAGDNNSLIINLGNGNNTAKLSGVTTDGFGQVNSATGNNTISLNNVTFNTSDSGGSNNGVFTGTGKQNISLSNATLNGRGGPNGVFTGTGPANISLSSVSLVANGGDNGVFTGTGAENISLSHVEIDQDGGGTNGVFTGNGNSNISLSSVTMNLVVGTSGVATGNGNQNIRLSNVTMSISTGGTNEVETGNGVQNIILSHVQMNDFGGGDNEVSTGKGTTVLAISNSQFSAIFASNQFFTGGGTTILTMSQVDMTGGPDSHQNLIDVGSGTAAIALSSVNMKVGDNNSQNIIDLSSGTATLTAVKLNMTCGDNGTNLIQSVTSYEVLVLSDFTTSGGIGSFNHIVTSGVAAVSITNWNSTGDARVENNGGPWSLAIAGANLTDGLAINGDDASDVVSLAKVTTYSLNVSLNGGNDLMTLTSCTSSITVLDGGAGSDILVRVHDSLSAPIIANFEHVIG
jgi:hypothetical protein